MRSMLRVVCLCVGAVASLSAAPAHAQVEQPPVPPVPGSALEPGRNYADELSGPGDQKVLRINTTAPFSLVQVTITRTNAECEIWARLVDIDGTTLGRSFVFGNATGTVTALATTAGPLILLIDDGPFVDCGGAEFRFTVAIEGFDPSAAGTSDAPAASVAQRTRNVMACMSWSSRAETLSLTVSRITRQVRTARGGSRTRLSRRLTQARRSYNQALASKNRYC